MILKKKWPFYYREKVQIYIDIIGLYLALKHFLHLFHFLKTDHLSEQTKTVVQAQNNRLKQEEFK